MKTPDAGKPQTSPKPVAALDVIGRVIKEAFFVLLPVFAVAIAEQLRVPTKSGDEGHEVMNELMLAVLILYADILRETTEAGGGTATAWRGRWTALRFLGLAASILGIFALGIAFFAKQTQGPAAQFVEVSGALIWIAVKARSTFAKKAAEAFFVQTFKVDVAGATEQRPKPD